MFCLCRNGYKVHGDSHIKVDGKKKIKVDVYLSSQSFYGLLYDI